MPIEKIEPTAPLALSADIQADNIAKLKALFPELLSESGTGTAINVDVLKALVGDATATDADEKYGLNWHGKRRARQLALTPSTGTLRPCPDESLDWDSTQNLMIEGDNLEVLKLLQKSYAGKVKLIYIDPPYNTGKDFVYPDNFQDNIKNYLELTGQVEGGAKISSNTESSGRFHTDWLNMMYPRLKLAKNLLTKDGLFMASIDDHEVHNFRSICDDVFGEESFLIQFVWRRRAMSDSRNEDRASTDHEYVVCYKMPEAQLKGNSIDQTKYSNPDNDPRGPWFSADLTGIANKQERPNLHYVLINPKTSNAYPPSPTRGWSCSRETITKMIEENRVLWPSKPDGRPRNKKFLSEITRFETGFSSWLANVGQTSEGTQTIQELFGEKVFQFSKPGSLLRALIEQATPDKDGLILDLFSGSGTTGHAVFEQNAKDGGNRRFVLVQLPEPIKENNTTIAELTKERLRRAAIKIRTVSAGTACASGQLDLEPSPTEPAKPLDLGFRVFKLDHSNIRAWNPDRDDLAQTLLDHEEHILTGRTENDIVYELLLKLGLDLCVPMQARNFAGKTVSAIGGGVLMTCLAEEILVFNCVN